MKRFAVLLAFLMYAAFGLQAQGVQVTGSVTGSEDGAPLPGVSVVVKGTTIGTVTDVNGDYLLSVPSGATTLVFGFVGMKAVEAPINNRSVIDIVMEPDALNLDEVVVTAIGITRQQKSLGYSMVNVSADEAVQRSEPDLLKALQGKVPGVDIRSSSGTPGAATRITIRGASSFYGDNQPLFVVDGVPYSNVMVTTTNQNEGGGAYGSGISTLDPNDIASMSVLKGAAAAALYGSRAMNGVVIISTKSGSAQMSKRGMEVTLTSSVNFETISNFPEYQNTYGAGSNFDYSNANGSWGPRFDSRDSIPTWSNEYRKLGWGAQIPYVAQPNNAKDLFRTGVAYDNSLNISGGNERSSVNVTASALNNEGYIPFSSFNRYSASVGGATKLENGLKVNANLAYTSSKQVGGIFGNNQASSDEAASSFARALWGARNWIYDPYTTVDGGPLQPNGDQFDNPLWSWRHNQVISDVDRIVANVGLNYDLNSWLSLSYKLGINNYSLSRKQIIDIGSRAYGKTGGLVTDDYALNELESNLILTVNRQIGENLSFTGLVGHNVNQRNSDRSIFQGKGYTVENIYDMNNMIAVVPYGGGITERRLIGAFADATLGWDNYAYLNLSYRRDWSSTLPPENNAYSYYASSLSFIFTEAFESLKSDVFNFGKVRLGWGKVGNDASPYSVYDSYGLYNPIRGQAAIYTPDVGYSTTLSPEFKTEFEAGTNLAFYNGRIGVDFTWYSNASTDQIAAVSVAASSGYTEQYANIGEMTNKGVELGLDLVPVKTTTGFEWSMYLSFTKNNSEIVEIVEGVDKVLLSGLFGDPSAYIAIGQPYGVFYGEKNSTYEGQLLIDQGTGLLIRDTELDFYGDPNPDYLTSLSNTLTFKGFSLSFLLDFRKGGDVYSNSVPSMLGRGVTKDTEDREKTVIIPGVYGNPNTGEPLRDGNGDLIPNITQVTVNDLYFGESFAINSAGYWNVYDGTTFRLREVSLGYSFPKKILDKTPFGAAVFSVTGRNLWRFSPYIPEYTNFDPDINGYGSSNVQGIEYDVAPSVKRIGFNLKLSF